MALHKYQMFQVVWPNEAKKKETVFLILMGYRSSGYMNHTEALSFGGWGLGFFLMFFLFLFFFYCSFAVLLKNEPSISS